MCFALQNILTYLISFGPHNNGARIVTPSLWWGNRLGKVWELVHGGKTGKRKNLLKICSKLGFLALSSVLLLLKVSSLETFLQRLHCALYVCVGDRSRHVGTYVHTSTHAQVHAHMHCTHVHRTQITQMHTRSWTHMCAHRDARARTRAHMLAQLKPQERSQ